MSRRRQNQELRRLDEQFADMQHVLLSAAMLDADIDMSSDSNSAASSDFLASSSSSSSSESGAPDVPPMIQTVAEALQSLADAYASIREEAAAPRVSRPDVSQLRGLDWARKHDHR